MVGKLFQFYQVTGKFDCGQALDLLVSLLPAELVNLSVNNRFSSCSMLIVVCLALEEADNCMWDMFSCGPGNVPTTGLQANCLLGCSLAVV